MQTFETVNKAEITNSQGIKYLDFRNGLKAKYTLVWLEIFSGYLALAGVIFGAVYFQNHFAAWYLLTIPVAGFLIGYIVAALHLYIHEASHYHLSADRKRNDLLSNIFLGLLVGMHVEYYRAVHFAHHRLLGTSKDTEKSYFDALTWRFFAETLAGIRVVKVFIHRHENIKLHEGQGVGLEIIKKNNRLFIIAVLLNLALVGAFFAAGYWQVSLAWMFGMGAAFPFFASFRQVLEHRSVKASLNTNYHEVDHGIIHRMFGEGPIASTLGAAGFNRHLIHHWDPSVSCTRLKDVEAFLMDTALNDDLEQSRTTYFKTFIGILNN